MSLWEGYSLSVQTEMQERRNNGPKGLNIYIDKGRVPGSQKSTEEVVKTTVTEIQSADQQAVA